MDIRSLRFPQGRGVATYTRGLLGALARLRPEVHFACFQCGPAPWEPPAELRLPNVSVAVVDGGSTRLNLRLRLTGRPRPGQVLGGPDVLFCPNLGVLPRRDETSLVLSFHDLSFETHRDLFSARERAWHRLVGARRLAHRATALLANSEATRGELATIYQVDPARVTVVHPGIDAAYRDPVPERERAAVRARHGLSAPYALMLGALEPRKEPETAVEAHRLAREGGLGWDLALAGAPERLPARLRRQPPAGVRLLGYVPERDKPALYAEAEALLFPSLHEGFGLPPLEALAAGTVSVVSDLPVFRETLGEGALRVPPGDAAALAQRLLELAADPGLAPSVVERWRPALERFTWEAAAQACWPVLAAAARMSA